MIVIKPVWVKPWFKNGFTEYQVVRRITKLFNAGYRDSNDYSVDYDTLLYKAMSIEDAIAVRNKMIAGGTV